MHFTITIHDLTADELRTVATRLGIGLDRPGSPIFDQLEKQPGLFSEILPVSSTAYTDATPVIQLADKLNQPTAAQKPLRRTSESSRAKWMPYEDALIQTLVQNDIEIAQIKSALFKKCGSERSEEAIRCRIWKLARLAKKNQPFTYSTTEQS